MRVKTGPIPPVTLDFAREMFMSYPSNISAAVYLRTLIEYESDDMITDDTFLDGLADIAYYLDPNYPEVLNGEA